MKIWLLQGMLALCLSLALKYCVSAAKMTLKFIMNTYTYSTYAEKMIRFNVCLALLATY